MKSLSISKSKNNNRGAFVTFQEYLDVVDDTKQMDNIYDPDIDYAKSQYLRSSMKEALLGLKNSTEIFGLSAQQIGIPASAVFVKYKPEKFEEYKEGEIFLTDPEMQLREDSYFEFFLKVIKCPTSPIPYHIGVFSREVDIVSSNGVDFKITDKNRKLDPHLDLSAAIQSSIWADKGFVIGDDSPLLLSYVKTCFHLQKDLKFRNEFDCIIHKDEIQKIVDNIKLIDVIGLHKTGATILAKNFINLLCKYPDKDWIRVPSVNMLKTQV